MKFFAIALLGVAVLAGCAGQPRSDAPAPVESSRSRVHTVAPAPNPIPTPPKKETVEVYAYRPPSAAPDAISPPEPQAVKTDTSGSAGSMVSLPSESATQQPLSSENAAPVASPQTPSLAPAGVPRPEPGTSGTPEPVDVAPAPAPEIVAYSAPPPPMPELAPAAGALAAQAERQREAGDYVGAAATLERALRIQPREAYLYNRLARIRLEQGRYAQAGNFAWRSNSLAKDQPQLKQDNWGMIAVSRRVAGDAAGAAEAEARARGG